MYYHKKREHKRSFLYYYNIQCSGYEDEEKEYPRMYTTKYMKKKYLRVEYYIYKILQHIYMMSIYIKNNISWFLELSFVSFPLGIYKKCISLKIEVECRWKKLSLLDAMRDQNIIHVFIHYTKIRSKTKLSENDIIQ